MLHSFVVGRTPEGQRQALFVGTIGEARGFADAAKAAGGVVDGTWYRRIDVCEWVDPTHVMEFAAPPDTAPPPPETAPPTTASRPPRGAARSQARPARTTGGGRKEPSAPPPVETAPAATPRESEGADTEDAGI